MKIFSLIPSILALVSLFGGTISSRAVIVVTNLANSGPGTLRTAVAMANTNAGQTITFDTALSGQTITLTTGQLMVTNNMTIDAAALAGRIVISGNNSSRMFRITSTATVRLDSMVLISGSVSSDSGGAILNSGQLTAIRCDFTNSTARGGNGVSPGPTLNGGGGGGGAGMGGAIFSDGGLLTLSNCFFNGNRAMGGNGGAGEGTTSNDDPGGNGGGPNGGAGGAIDNRGNPGGYGGGGGGGAGSGSTGYAGGYGGFGGGGGGGGAVGGGGSGDIGGNGGIYGGKGGRGAYSNAGGGGGGAGVGGAVFVKAGTLTVVSSAFASNLATNGLGGYGGFGDGNGQPGQGVGGGLFLYCANPDPFLLGNVFSNNVATSFAPDLTTLPVAITLPVTGLAAVGANVSATLQGKINPCGTNTTAWFEWGTGWAHDQKTTPVALGSGLQTLGVTYALANLTPGKVYHYRVVATNSQRLVRGPSRMFWLPALSLNGASAITNLCHQAFIDPGATATVLSPVGIEVGSYHNVALKADGRPMAWGQGIHGETNVSVAATNIISVGAGSQHNVALRNDGSLVAWGTNDLGQLNIPASATNIVAVAAGYGQNLALRGDGTILGWGQNGAGEATVPTNAYPALAIAAGGYHCLALRADGTVVGWGLNNYWQSVAPAGLSNVVDVAAGHGYSVALLADGTVRAWGDNTYGGATVPADATNLVALAAKAWDTHGLRRNRTLVAWGRYDTGQTNLPSGLTNVVDSGPGVFHGVALLGDATLRTWGTSNYGQTNIPADLGPLDLPVAANNPVNVDVPGSYTLTYTATNPFGGFVSSNRIVRIVDAPAVSTLPASSVSANGTNVSATFNGTANPNGAVSVAWFEWSANCVYDHASVPVQLGGGFNTLPVSTAPGGLTAGLIYHYRLVVSNFVGVVYGADQRFWAPGIALNGPARQTNECHLFVFNDPATAVSLPPVIAAGGYHSLALRGDGAVFGWGAGTDDSGIDNNYGQVMIPASATNLTALGGGYVHSLGLRLDGTVIAWGNNTYDQTNCPASATNVQRIAAGGYHNLALRGDGTVVGWGDNTYLQTACPSEDDFTAVAAGLRHSLGLQADGTVVGWGRNLEGQTNCPTGTNFTAIAAGGHHSLALREDTTVVGWGNNANHQNDIPASATNVVAIAASTYQDLALLADGTVLGWGYNRFGQATGVPNNTAPYLSTGLVVVASQTLSNVVAIAAGDRHSLALQADGTVVGWGDDWYGQITPPPGASNLNLPLWVTGTVNTDSPGTNVLNYSTTNTLGIVATATRTVVVRDTLPPTLTLNGPNWLMLEVGTSYTDAGATAWDICAGDRTASIVSNLTVNTSIPGVYTNRFTVADGNGNTAATNRIVRVVTVPTVATLPVTNITAGGAALRGQVKPNGLDTVAWFEWGLTPSYDTRTEDIPAGSDFSAFGPSFTVEGLIPEATCYYRAVASNSLGVVYGTNSSFITLSTNCNLASLSLVDGALVPAFDSAVTDYAVSVPNQVGCLQVSPVKAHFGATIHARANGGAYVPVASGGVGPFVINVGLNLVEVRVTAEDGLTTKVYALNVSRGAPYAMGVGPAYPPPLGVSFSDGGVTNTEGGLAGGKTWVFSNVWLSAQTPVFWGATNDGVKLSFDNSIYTNNEILTYRSDLSDLAHGMVVWSGITTSPPPVRTVYTRFVLNATNLYTGVALPLVEAASLGLATNIGAVVRVTDPWMAWKAVLRFQASLNPDGPFQPALVFFNNLPKAAPGSTSYFSFGAGFYHFNLSPTLTANNLLTVDRGAGGTITSAHLGGSDFESGPAQLRFNIAPQGEGAPPHAGTLWRNGSPLGAGDFFTQEDINLNRLTYVHDGLCSSNDNFTFNITDEHGGATPTGEHTTYTFPIAVVHTNLPPLALDGWGYTGLGTPYHGVVQATNGDCTPQTLTFDLVLVPPPTKGSVWLNTNTGEFTYTPALGQSGTASFTFTVNDGLESSPVDGLVRIIVSNMPPVAIAGSGGTRENVSLNGTLTGTDPDLPAQALSFSIVTDGAKGHAEVSSSSNFTFTPHPGAIGPDAFTFRAHDGILSSPPATYTITIRPNVEEGDLLVSDRGAGQIVLVDPTGAQGVVSSGGLLTGPRGLAVEPGGAIFVLDGANGLLRIDPVTGGQTIVCASTNFSATDMSPYGVALESAGTAMVADGPNGVLRVDLVAGTVSTLAVGGQLTMPLSVALATDGDVFVGDIAGALGLSSRIVRVERSTGAQSPLSTNVLVPAGLALDGPGNLLVADAPTLVGLGEFDSVLQFEPTNSTPTQLTASNLLAGAIGLTVGSTGTVYVANMISNSIVAVATNGTQTLFTSGGLLVMPSAIAVVPNPNLNRVLSIQVASDRVDLLYQGIAGRSYTLQRSTNLTAWDEVSTATGASNGQVAFADLAPPVDGACYRVRSP